MIDINTGNITLNKDFIINRNSNFDSVRKLELGEIQEVDDMGNGWIWLRIKNILVSGEYFNISFAFDNLKIKELSFIVSDKKFNLESKSTDWNEQKESEKLKMYQDWLKKKIGSQRQFNWGEIWTDYDKKGGCSSIGLRYNKE